MFDPMSDLADDSAPQQGDPLDGDSAPAPAQQGGGGGGGGRYSNDVHSISIRARQRTFYIDLKESGNGKFFKVSEKSRGGQKTTIIFDSEDLDEFIAAFQEMKQYV